MGSDSAQFRAPAPPALQEQQQEGGIVRGPHRPPALSSHAKARDYDQATRLQDPKNPMPAKLPPSSRRQARLLQGRDLGARVS